MKKMYRAGSDAVEALLEPVVYFGKSLSIGAEMGHRVMTHENFDQELSCEGLMSKALDKSTISPERKERYRRKYNITT